MYVMHVCYVSMLRFVCVYVVFLYVYVHYDMHVCYVAVGPCRLVI